MIPKGAIVAELSTIDPAVIGTLLQNGTESGSEFSPAQTALLFGGAFVVAVLGAFIFIGMTGSGETSTTTQTRRREDISEVEMYDTNLAPYLKELDRAIDEDGDLVRQVKNNKIGYGTERNGEVEQLATIELTDRGKIEVEVLNKRDIMVGIPKDDVIDPVELSDVDDEEMNKITEEIQTVMKTP